MKFLVSFLVICLASTAFAKLECTIRNPDINSDWIDIQKECTNSIREQIQKEIDASFDYLAMGAHFSRDTINRPGFAEHFFKAAREEREHGMHLIEYLLMRGQLTDSVTDLITIPTVKKHEWKNGAESLADALSLEAKVTKSIRDVIEKCEKIDAFNDYHLVDYLSGVYLEEQYKGQRELAGKLSTLKKMMTNHGELGEFLFDKTLLE